MRLEREVDDDDDEDDAGKKVIQCFGEVSGCRDSTPIQDCLESLAFALATLILIQFCTAWQYHLFKAIMDAIGPQCTNMT